MHWSSLYYSSMHTTNLTMLLQLYILMICPKIPLNASMMPPELFHNLLVHTAWHEIWSINRIKICFHFVPFRWFPISIERAFKIIPPSNILNFIWVLAQHYTRGTGAHEDTRANFSLFAQPANVGMNIFCCGILTAWGKRMRH